MRRAGRGNLCPRPAGSLYSFGQLGGSTMFRTWVMISAAVLVSSIVGCGEDLNPAPTGGFVGRRLPG